MPCVHSTWMFWCFTGSVWAKLLFPGALLSMAQHQSWASSWGGRVSSGLWGATQEGSNTGRKFMMFGLLWCSHTGSWGLNARCDERGARSEKKVCDWSSTSSRELKTRVEQSTAQSCHCGTRSKASTSPRSLGPAAKPRFHSQKSQRNPFEVQWPQQYCTLRGLPALLLIAGVYSRYSQWSAELQPFCGAG